MPIPIVTIAVQTTNGYNFSPLYKDIAGATNATNKTSAGFTITNPSATNYPSGLSFVLTSQTNDFTYDPNTNQPLTGTINSINIYDSSNNLLVTEIGFSISVTDMINAVNLYNNSNGSNTSGLNSIFNNYRYTDTGNTGADTFLSAANADSFSGGSGSDWVSYQNAAAGITADLANSSLNTGEAAGDTYTSIENLRGSSSNDTLIGNSGNNFLRGGPGADWLQGGGGSDTADYKGATSGVIADLTTPAFNTGDAAGDTYTLISNLRGTDFNDVLKGNSNSNTLTGGLGADRFIYSGGADTVADFDQGAGNSIFNHAEGDKIDLGTSKIYSFTELQSDLSQVGLNTVITVGVGNTITLTNIDSTQLTASDFFFTPAPYLLVSIGGGAIASGGLPVGGGTFNQFVAFGDSTIDSGYFRNTPISTNPALQADYNAAVAAGGGIPTTLGGTMVSTLLAQDYGLTANPSNAPGGGTNYAASGATVVGSLSGSLAPNVISQVNSYLTTTGNVADPNAIYLISAGGNDTKTAATLDPVAAVNYMVASADSMAASIEQLHADGAQYFVINFFSGNKNLGVPYANELITDLTNAGVQFIVGDELSLLTAINANPNSYGITNTLKPSTGPYSPGNPYNSANGGATINPDPSLITNGWARYATTNVAPDANTHYLWADNEHLAAAGQLAEANYIHSLVENAVPLVGQNLAATPTLLNSSGPVTYQWQHFDGVSWSGINNATNANYTVLLSDVGDELRVEAFNSYDSGNSAVSAFSAPTIAVVACYCLGTLILTDDGEVPVQDLKIGDQVITKSGASRPIKWIGRRSYGGRFLLGQKHILPVCIKAGALDENTPRRDLWISPHHAMYLEGVLIEARDLVNSVNIVQPDDTESVEYFHIELDTHDVIIAEGSLSETFIDDDSRGMFHNAHEYPVLYPEEQQAPVRYYAPRCDSGYEVDAARRRIEGRAGLRPANREQQFTLRGYVDRIGPDAIEGWVQNVEHPEAPVCLDIYVGDRMIGQTLANRYREDLEQAGLGSGRHSFEFTPPAGLRFTPDEIEVRRSLDGVTIQRATSPHPEPKPISAVRRYVKTVKARSAA